MPDRLDDLTCPPTHDLDLTQPPVSDLDDTQSREGRSNLDADAAFG